MTEAANEIAQLASSHMWEGVGAWTAWKLLGPPALELTEGARRWMADKIGNTRAIVEKAAEMAGDDLEQPGRVHPRVVARVFEEGSNISDPVMQTYLAGMLKASRTEDGADDRAAYYLGVISNLTSNQVRTHFGIYSALARADRPTSVSLQQGQDLHQVAVRVPLAVAVDVLEPETARHRDYLGETVAGLAREGLTGAFGIGTPADLARQELRAVDDSLVVIPSSMGALLYLWGAGVPTARPDDLGRVPTARAINQFVGFQHAEVGEWAARAVRQRDIVRVERDLDGTVSLIYDDGKG